MTELIIPDKPRFLAVCHTCNKQHMISEQQFLHADAMRDWEMKHRGHTIEFLDPNAYDLSYARHAVGEYRHNADIKVAYASAADYTITLASLATSSSLLAGRESSSVSNASNLYLDYLVSGVIRVGTTPTTDTSIQVLAIGPRKGDTPNWPDVFDGTDSAETITSDGIKNAIARFAADLDVDSTTSDRDYPFGPVSLVSLFGLCPKHHVLFVTHNTGVNLNATGANHVLSYQGVYATAT